MPRQGASSIWTGLVAFVVLAVLSIWLNTVIPTSDCAAGFVKIRQKEGGIVCIQGTTE